MQCDVAYKHSKMPNVTARIIIIIIKTYLCRITISVDYISIPVGYFCYVYSDKGR